MFFNKENKTDSAVAASSALRTAVAALVFLCACGKTPEAEPVQLPEETVATPTEVPAAEVKEETEAEPTEALSEIPADEPAVNEKEEENMKDPVLLYQGHASLRIVTGDDKVIYIDPFSSDGYDLPADLILQTHDHFDHKDMSKIQSRTDDCRLITQVEALAGGTHQNFDLGYVKVEAVEAGYNKNHNKNNCVGYILTFPNEVSVYVSGDTSKTEQMASLADRNLDYAFYCCDGVYNMDAAEASECAALVGAKVNIPYHTGSAAVTNFDEENAKLFNAPGATVITPGSELVLKK